MINSSIPENSCKGGRLRLLLALILLNLTTTAWSQCTYRTSDGSPYFIAETNEFNVPELNLNAFRNGDVIYKQIIITRIINMRGGVARIACSGSSVYLDITGASNSPPLQPYRTYPSTILNIGIRIAFQRIFTPLPSGGRYEPSFDFNREMFMFFEISLIKTGNIGAGGMLTGAFAWITSQSPRQRLVEFRFGSPVPVIPRIPTCKTSTAAVNVDMGSTPTTSFQGVGSGSPPRPFKIALSCSGGDTGTSTNAHVTLTDANTPGNTSTTLSLVNGSTSGRQTASGIGIEILNKGQPIGFGPDSSVAGNTNQWFAGSISQGQTVLEIPLEARYVQTAPSISPGSADARATFTFSYQ